jgi:hypothetical protein
LLNAIIYIDGKIKCINNIKRVTITTLLIVAVRNRLGFDVVAPKYPNDNGKIQ